MKSWLVTLRLWEEWQVQVEAPSQEAAEERAEEMWSDHKPHDWECTDMTIESVHAEEESDS